MGECRPGYNKEYYQKHKEDIKKKAKVYYGENREEIDKKNRVYSLKNTEHISVARKINYKKKRTSILENVKKYRDANKDIINIRKKNYRDNNKGLISKRARNYSISHPNVGSISRHTRRARILKLPATLTETQWVEIKLYFKNKCAYCGKELPLAQDHFMALANGGEYTHNNIIPACKSCNSSKHVKDFFEWYPRQKYYSKQREYRVLKYLGYKRQKQQLSIF